MDDFKERVRFNVSKGNSQNPDNCLQSSFNTRMYQYILDTLSELPTTNIGDEMSKVELMMNLDKIFGSYEELRPTLTEFFQKKSKVDTNYLDVK